MKNMIPWLVDDLLRNLQHAKPRRFKVVVMPDFFVDRFVSFPGDAGLFTRKIEEVVFHFGGNIHGVKQMELRGGNAANTSAALAKLGATVSPIIKTGQLGLRLLEFYLEPLGVDLSHVKVEGETALTTALEFRNKDERVNVMMGDLGSLPSFGPKDLDEADMRLLKESDYACVFNWAPLKQGTELAETVFNYVKTKGKAKTYYDTGDPTPNKKSISKLVKKVLFSENLDVLSVNENEALQYARQIDQKAKKAARKVNRQGLAKECARILARHVFARVDLHTSAFAGSYRKDDEVIVPSFSVNSLRTTGAGDAWNAGNILGDALRLPDSCRLTLANAVAAFYVSSLSAEHPSLSEIVDFCAKQRQ
jgi:sugar/nucleoside kinase (ribokinase family)